MRELKSLLASEHVSLGTWSQIAAPEMVDLIGLNGFEFTIIDCEHGHFGIDVAENLSRAADAAGIASLVRVPRNDPVDIMKALDAGIRHVVVPNLSSAEEAERAISATRFGPHGLRGACPCCRSGGHYIRNWKAYVADEEARVGVVGLVETRQGHENFAEICRNTDIAAFMFGAFDLSVSMGLEGNWRHDRVLSAVRDMVDRAVDAGHHVMMPVFAPEPEECRDLVEEWRGHGVGTFVIGSDKILVASSFHDWTRALG